MTITTCRAARRLRPSREWFVSSRVVILAVLCCKVDASIPSDHPNNNNAARFNENSHQQQQQQQHVIFNRQLEFDITEETLNLSSETESLAFYGDIKDDPSTRSTSIKPVDPPGAVPLVASSTWTMYDSSGCFISAQALMCHGGDSMLQTASDNGLNLRSSNKDEENDLDDEDDDEDRDDDDGHSSMLSNASLRRRTRIFSTIATVSTSNDRGYYHATSVSSSGPVGSSSSSSLNFMHESSKGLSHFLTSKVMTRNQSPRRLTSQLLRLRGGGGITGSNPLAAASLGSEFAQKLLVAALVTLIYEALLGHILEFIKIAIQTSPPHTSYWDVIHSITAEKGLAGLWDGFCPWGILQAVFKGGVFGLAHAMATKLLHPLTQHGLLTVATAATLAGGLAGGCQGYVLSPTLLLKTRVMTDPIFREPMSLWKTTWMSARVGWDVVQVEGIVAIMKGANIFALKRVFDWATRYLFSDLLESWFQTIKGGGVIALTATEKSLASFLGGTASTLCTLPLDVLVAKTQDAKRAGVKVSAWKLFQDDLKAGGWSSVRDSYMRGFAVRLAHVCLTTVVIKTVSPLVHETLFGKA